MFNLYFEIGTVLTLTLCGLGISPTFIRKFGKVTWSDCIGMLLFWPLMLVIVYNAMAHKSEDDDTLY